MPRKILLLPTLLSLTIVAGCSNKAPTLQRFPPVSDLSAPTKPVITVDALSSSVVSERFNADIEAWGDGMALQLGRLCRWQAGVGMPVRCPPAPPGR